MESKIRTITPSFGEVIYCARVFAIHWQDRAFFNRHYNLLNDRAHLEIAIALYLNECKQRNYF